MNSYQSGGGYHSLSIYCNNVKNNHGEFGIVYQLPDADYAGLFDLETVKIIEGEDYLEQMIT